MYSFSLLLFRNDICIALVLLQFQSLLTDFKAQAEALIKFANNRDGLLTCVLRPSIVFGPGDTEFVPFLVNLAKSGYAKVWPLFHPIITLMFLLLDHVVMRICSL